MARLSFPCTRRERDSPHFPSAFAGFSRRIGYVFHIVGFGSLDVTSSGIKSTAGRCRHSQYGSSRCGLVIARTRINVCPDDSAIWWSDSIIGSPTRRRLRMQSREKDPSISILVARYREKWFRSVYSISNSWHSKIRFEVTRSILSTIISEIET